MEIYWKREPVSAVNSNFSGFSLPTEFKLKFGLFSKGWILDARFRKALEIARRSISKQNQKLASCVKANANTA